MTTFRSRTGEWALVDLPGDGTTVSLYLDRHGVVMEQVGVTNSTSDHAAAISGSSPADGPKGGVAVNGVGAAARNLVVTDTAGGVDSWTPNLGGEVYGNLILDIGWLGPDRGHGHGTYSQNPEGAPVKTIKHNLFAAPFSTGIKNGSNNGGESHFRVDENTVMLAGHHAAGVGTGIQHYSDNVPSVDMKYRGNRVYQPGWLAFTSHYLAEHRHFDIEMSDNWFFGGSEAALRIVYPWAEVTILRNTLYATTGYLVEEATVVPYVDTFEPLVPDVRNYDHNLYFGGRATPFRLAGGTGLTFAQWQAETGQDANSEHYPNDLPPAQVWVDANLYEAKRALITVWNPTEAATVGADLDAVLANGDPWYLYNAWNPYAGPITSGTYTTGQGIEVPMTGIVNRTPAGLTALPHDPKFAAFVVRSTATWVAPA